MNTHHIQPHEVPNEVLIEKLNEFAEDERILPHIGNLSVPSDPYTDFDIILQEAARRLDRKSWTKEDIARELDGVEYDENDEYNAHRNPIYNVANIADRQKLIIVTAIEGCDALILGYFKDVFRSVTGLGTDILINKNGLLPTWHSFIETAAFRNADEHYVEEHLKERKSARVISALYHKESDAEYKRSFKTDIPHASFSVLSDGRKYAKGIVISVDDLS